MNLNEVFPPAVAPARNRNNKLSTSERAVVDNILIKIENDSAYTWKDAIKDVSPIMRKYNNPIGSTKGLGGKVKYLPLEIIQFIYYVSYKYHVKQADMIKEFHLEKNGVTRDKSIFEMKVTVSDYRRCVDYQQPEMPIKYQGQKKGILAEALKHLVFQAGAYDCFIDIMGGSGAASLAVPRKDNSVYVFNDKDFGLYSLFDVLSDDKEYKTLMEFVNQLQNDISGKGVFRLLDVVGTTFAKEIEKYFSKKKRTIRREKLLYQLAKKHDTNEYPDEYGMLEQQFRFYGWYSYFNNLIEDSSKHNLIKNKVEKIDDVDIEDKVCLALAELYIWSFTYRSKKGVSSILSMQYTLEEVYQYKEESMVWSEFLDKDFSKLIEQIHMIVKKNTKTIDKDIDYTKKTPRLECRTITECMDFQDVLTKYSVNGDAKCRHKTPIFYSDYPYQGAAGYSVGEWSGDQSRILIDKLLQSGGKFIFSCRACCKKESGGNWNIDDIKEINRGIYNDVLNYFKEQTRAKNQNDGRKRQLWVARFSTKKRSFVDTLKMNGETEIMITNYEIQPFTYHSHGVIEIQRYEDFMKDISLNLIM